jgi:bla regulator protein BlaR1
VNTLALTLNHVAAQFAAASLTMVIQSSILIAVLAALDWLLRNRVRAIVRYSLWMLLLVKLVLPVNFSLPTSVVKVSPTVHFPPVTSPERSAIRPPTTGPLVAGPSAELGEQRTIPPPAPSIRAGEGKSRSGFTVYASLLMAWAGVSATLFCVAFWKSVKLRRLISMCAPASAELNDVLGSCCEQMRVRSAVTLRTTEANITPALCGIFRPCIVLPTSLPAALEPQELRAVLLHELAHLRRWDVQVNLVQTVLQIVYFFHPLLWVANARIRKLREQAVDELVLVTLGKEAEVYPLTLLDVAKFTVNARVLTFGTVGIIESRSALGARIRRILSHPFPSHARLGAGGAAAVLLLGVCVLPMASVEKEPSAIRVAVEPGQNQAATVTRKSEAEKVAEAQRLASRTETEKVAAGIREKSGAPYAGKTTEQLLAMYELQGEFRSPVQAQIYNEILCRDDAVLHLARMLHKDPLRSDTPAELRKRLGALTLLAQKGAASGALPELIDALEDEEEVRGLAIDCLGRIGPQASTAIPALLEELKFQNGAAAHALARIAPDSERVQEAIVNEAMDDSKAPGFRLSCLAAVQQMRVRTPRLNGALKELAAGSDEQLRRAALRASGEEPPRQRAVRTQPREGAEK